MSDWKALPTTSTAKCEKCGVKATRRYGGTHSRCDAHPYGPSRIKHDHSKLQELLNSGITVMGRQGPLRGPCGTCGGPFRSFDPRKIYCSHDCYAKSGRMHLNLGNPKPPPRVREARECDHCGDKVSRIPSRFKATHWTFCAMPCYRAFLSERFDRFIANPESVALPQNYDEFLDRTELPCPVDGCEWSGKFLSCHARIVHSFQARDFKKALGFNVGSGLVAKDVAVAMSEAAKARGPNGLVPNKLGIALGDRLPDDCRHPSAEAREHMAKARALRSTVGEIAGKTIR